LRERAMAAELRRSEVVSHHAAKLSQMLYPEDALQERGIAGIFYLARHGSDLLKNIYDSIHTDCLDHQILEL
jgi:bacillithiol synthase